MKNVLYFVVLTLSCKLVAQDPLLFDTTWVLHELNINNTIVTPPNSQVLSELTFLTDGINNAIEVNQNSCVGYAGEILEFNDNDSFFNLLEFADPFGANCSGDDSLFTFLQNHASVYIDLPSSPPLNPFNYEITEDNDVLTLTITNGNNDIATYRNVPLGLEETSIDTLKIVYDVQNELLTLEGSLIPQTKATIYTLAGQKQQENVLKPNTPLDVKTLSIGVYLITLENDVGQQITQKFVKY